jgi:hypothetical protein
MTPRHAVWHRAAPALALLACATGHAAPQDSISWFRSTTQALFDAVAGGDTAVWDRVLDADCVITTEDGEVLTRRRFLAQMRPLPPGFSGHIRVRDLSVRAAGDAAVVHYWLDETESIFGQQLKTTYAETDVYRPVSGSWKIVAMQVTVVPRDLEPVAVDRSGWSALIGEYRYDPRATSRYHVFLRDGGLYGGRDPKSATRLIPLAPLVFFQQGSIHIMVFVRDSAGGVTEVRELHKYNEVRMERVAGGGEQAAAAAVAPVPADRRPTLGNP